MPTNRKVVDFKIHNLTEEKFQELKDAGQIDPNAIYCTPDESLKTDQITNCIAEILQDIKLELADGAIILKAGSKVYVPNGSGNYTKIAIENDLSRTVIKGFEGVLFYYPEENRLSSIDINYCSSGTVLPSALIGTNHWVHYKTDDNRIYYTEDAGETWSRTYSFPLCVFTSEGTTIPEEAVITKINQVFNEFGYIGSTLFSLSSVKAIFPSGRKANGTLNNLVRTTVVSTLQVSGTSEDAPIYVANTGKLYSLSKSISYDEESNYNISDGVVLGVCNCGTVSFSANRITSINPKTAFHAVDYSDFETLYETVETNNDNAVHKDDFENTVEELNNSISAVDSSVVHKTGDETIGGTKTFAAPSLKISNVAGTGGTGLTIRDSNGKGQTYVQQFYTNGQYYSRLVNRNDAAAKTAYVEIVVHDDGRSRFDSHNVDTMYAPTPAASSNDTNIATTAFVKSVLSSSGNGLATFSKRDSGYYKFNNGLIIQWGQSSGNAVPRTITMPTAFTGATTFKVFVQPLVEGTTYNFYQPGVDNTSKTTTTFKVYSSSYVAETGWYWVAIGY